MSPNTEIHRKSNKTSVFSAHTWIRLVPTELRAQKSLATNEHTRKLSNKKNTPNKSNIYIFIYIYIIDLHMNMNIEQLCLLADFSSLSVCVCAYFFTLRIHHYKSTRIRWANSCFVPLSVFVYIFIFLGTVHIMTRFAFELK